MQNLTPINQLSSTQCLSSKIDEAKIPASGPLTAVQQHLEAQGPAEEFFKISIPSLATENKEGEVFGTRELIEEIKNLSEASDLTLAEQLAVLLCELYRLIAKRSGKIINFYQFIELISQWTSQEVAAKFLEFCWQHVDFFTEKDFWMLTHCTVLMDVNSAALGGIEAYLSFRKQWIAMMENVVQALEKRNKR